MRLDDGTFQLGVVNTQWVARSAHERSSARHTNESRYRPVRVNSPHSQGERDDSTARRVGDVSQRSGSH
jgi:hypothetical protein